MKKIEINNFLDYKPYDEEVKQSVEVIQVNTKEDHKPTQEYGS